MTSREEVLARLPDGSGALAPGLPAIGIRRAESDSLWECFLARFAELGGRVVTWRDLRELDARKWSVDLGVDVSRAGAYEPANAWDAELGFTRVVALVAETATLVLTHGPGSRRLGSLAPPIHVAVVRRDLLLGTLEEAVPVLGAGNAVFVTGPSRTADIEGIMIRGVHGPGELWIVEE